jgi:hypothetical protein
MVDVVVHRERQLAVGAIDRAGRRVHEVLDMRVAAGFEHVDEADDVAVDLGLRIFQ